MYTYWSIVSERDMSWNVGVLDDHKLLWTGSQTWTRCYLRQSFLANDWWGLGFLMGQNVSDGARGFRASMGLCLAQPSQLNPEGHSLGRLQPKDGGPNYLYDSGSSIFYHQLHVLEYHYFTTTTTAITSTESLVIWMNLILSEIRVTLRYEDV